MANIVTVADVGKLETLERAELFFKCEKIGQSLAGMKTVAESVDDRDGDGSSHFVQNMLLVDPRDDALHPTFEIAGDIGNRFAFAQTGLGVVEKHDIAAHALDTDFKGDPGAQGWLLKNKSEMLAP